MHFEYLNCTSRSGLPNYLFRNLKHIDFKIMHQGKQFLLMILLRNTNKNFKATTLCRLMG